jgi:hypothetical protein
MHTRCLEVRVADRPIFVPLECVANVAEFALTPAPPLAQPRIFGLGLDGTQPFVVVTLRDQHERVHGGSKKCVLFKQSGTRFAWGLEVDSVGRMSEVEVHSGPRPDAWLLLGRDARGAQLTVLDVDAITLELENGPRARRDAEARRA